MTHCTPHTTNLKTQLICATIAISVFIGCLKYIQFNYPLRTKQNYNPNQTIVLWEKSNSQILKYAEANPDALVNIPDETRFFSFRDQQSAQPEKSSLEEESQLPKSKGESENVKVITGSLVNENEPSTLPPSATSILDEKMSRSEPLDSIQTKENRKEEGVNIQDFDSTKNTKRKIISFTENGDEIIPTTDKSSSIDSQIQEMKKRPKLSQNLTTGSRLFNDITSPRVGQIAVECKLNPFGIYVQKMLRSIEEQWHQLIRGANQYIQYHRFPPKVIFSFSLQANGEIKDLSCGNDKPNELGIELCRQSIASRAPFGKWTDEMINSFGYSDQVTITFEYK